MYQLTLSGEEKLPEKKYVTVCKEMVANYGVFGSDLSQIIGIILGGNVKKETCLRLTSLGIGELSKMTVEELISYEGITPNGATRLVLAFDLARRLSNSKKGAKKHINNPNDAYEVFKDIQSYDKEVFQVALLNTKNGVIATETISVGTINMSIVHPREVFRQAIKRSAHAIIVAHNHPSGDPTPSKNDIEMTKVLERAGVLLNIKVLDHLIIGDYFISLKEKGIF